MLTQPIPATVHLTQIGRATAARFQLPCIVEHSDRSEATYLHVQRNHVWYGIRIACHAPRHACSKDYQQIIIPHAPDHATFTVARATTMRAVEQGGLVVADPRDVRAAIDRLEYERADGTMVCGSSGQWWRWCFAEVTWHCVTGPATLPANNMDEMLRDGGELAQVTCAGHLGKPEFVPRARVSSLDQCVVRHQLNFRERWAYDVAVASEPSIESPQPKPGKPS